jgi:hypothetical protein
MPRWSLSRVLVVTMIVVVSTSGPPSSAWARPTASQFKVPTPGARAYHIVSAGDGAL